MTNEEITNRIQDLEDEIASLREMNKGYWVAVAEIGHETCYYPLGYMTELKAKELAENAGIHEWFIVSKEEYSMFCDAANLNHVINMMVYKSVFISHQELLKALITDLKQLKKELEISDWCDLEIFSTSIHF